MFSRRARGALAASFALAGAILAGIPPAQASREKPVQVIVPFAPGGGSDTLARLLVRGINRAELASRPWIVINVPGAGGTIGSRRVKNARPDGRTILFLHDGIVTAKFARQATYGPEAFEPVAATGVIGAVICCGAEGAYPDLAALLGEAGNRPETVTFAANIGAPSYFMARLVEQAHGKARFRYVQSGGGARRFADLSGGHVTASAFSVSEYLAFRDGGIRALAFLGEERHPALPEVATAREQGVDVVYENVQAWWFPRGTPGSAISESAGVLEQAMHLPDVRESLARQQIGPVFLDGAGLGKAMERKASTIANLGLEYEMKHLPPLEAILVGLFLAGLAVALAGNRLAPAPGGEGTAAPLSTQDPRLLITMSGIVLAYLLALQWTESAFIPITAAFLAATLLLPRRQGKRRWWPAAAAAVAVPLLLHAFLERLLGFRMP